jgi:hypothetical protein
MTSEDREREANRRVRQPVRQMWFLVLPRVYGSQRTLSVPGVPGALRCEPTISSNARTPLKRLCVELEANGYQRARTRPSR